STKALPWEQFISEDGKFPVSGKSHKSKLYSVPDCQAIVKKAVAERLKLKYGVASKMPENGALYKIEVALHKDIATLPLILQVKDCIKEDIGLVKGKHLLKRH